MSRQLCVYLMSIIVLGQGNAAQLRQSVVFEHRLGGPSQNLQDHFNHKLVVVGRVGGIFRTAHTPYNNPGPEQHTVFTFFVEKVIKDEYGLQGRSIKIRQNMGDLPWRNEYGSVGVGRRIIGEPMLRPGGRYILFLMRPGDPKKSPHLIAEYNGFRGVSGESDEFTIPSGEFGQFKLERGVVAWSSAEGESWAKPWLFEDGPQIVGSKEAEAIKTLLQENAKREARRAKRIEEGKKELERQLEIAKRQKQTGSKPPPIP